MDQLLMIRTNAGTKCSLWIIKLRDLLYGRSVRSKWLLTQILHLVIVSYFEIISLPLLNHSFVFHKLVGFGVSTQWRGTSVRIGSLSVQSLVLVSAKNTENWEYLNPCRIPQRMQLKVHRFVDFCVSFGLTSPCIMSGFQLIVSVLIPSRTVRLAWVVASQSSITVISTTRIILIISLLVQVTIIHNNFKSLN